MLAPALFPSESKSIVRSRKSSAHRARQGPKTSVFETERLNGDVIAKAVPEEFALKSTKFVTTLREVLGANEVRALGASQVACPTLQVLLRSHQSFDTLIIW